MKLHYESCCHPPYCPVTFTNPMKKDKGPAYTVYNFKNGEEIHIKDRDGNVGEVYKQLESYRVRIISSVLTDESKQLALAKRMQAWYYNTQVNGK